MQGTLIKIKPVASKILFILATTKILVFIVQQITGKLNTVLYSLPEAYDRSLCNFEVVCGIEVSLF